MITTQNREYAIDMLKQAINRLEQNKEESDDSAISFIKSAYGEIN